CTYPAQSTQVPASHPTPTPDPGKQSSWPLSLAVQEHARELSLHRKWVRSTEEAQRELGGKGPGSECGAEAGHQVQQPSPRPRTFGRPNPRACCASGRGWLQMTDSWRWGTTCARCPGLGDHNPNGRPRPGPGRVPAACRGRREAREAMAAGPQR
ncbi:hypothetical protein U0070_026571, partial [Myodes glareolus]